MKEIFLKHVKSLEIKGYKLQTWEEEKSLVILGFLAPQSQNVIRFFIRNLSEIKLEAFAQSSTFEMNRRFIEKTIQTLSAIIREHPNFRLKILTGVTRISPRITLEEDGVYKTIVDRFNDRV